MAFQARLAREIGLTDDEAGLFRPLTTPEKVQDFITSMPANLELSGDTCMSVRSALRTNRCHCIEGAFIAACAFLLHGRSALLMDFQAHDDHDHVAAIFRRDGHWGAVSKSNSIWLRWRDPVYRTPRELAMSYFHEYVCGPNKSLRRISRPFDIGAYDPAYWITRESDCWDMANEIDNAPHFPLISASQSRRLRKREALECHADTVKEYDAGGKRLVHAPRGEWW